MKRNIIFLTEEVVKAGGVVRVVNNWANYFSEKQFHVEVIATDVDAPYYKFDEKITLTQHPFNFKNKILGIPYNLFYMFTLLRKLKQEKNVYLIVDRAVHIEPIWILKKILSYKNIHFIYFAHGGSSDFRDFYMNRWHTKHRVKMIFNAFNQVICLFDDEKNYPKEVKKEKLFFIENPLPFSLSEITFKEKENIVLSLGRVTKAKGIDTLIYAWDKIKNDVGDWKLNIVGEGEDKEEFVKLIEKLNIKNIEFINGTTKVKQYYDKSKIFIIPSIAEGMPMTILEAMACKSCVISSNTAGGKKLVSDKNTGLLFEVNDIEELSKNILYLMENDKKREELSKKAFEYVQQYKIENIYEKWNNLL